MAELNWTETQWADFNEAARAAFKDASVARQFITYYDEGLHPGTEIVRNELLVQDRTTTPPTLTLNGDHDQVNRRLVNLTFNVDLSGQDLANAMNTRAAFQRAARTLAQEEDRVVLAGYHRGFGAEDSQFVVNNVGPQEGLADLPSRRTFPDLDLTNNPTAGNAIVVAVVNAIAVLENNFNPGPFACVLGTRLFDEVHTPNQNLVLPADRIIPMLKGGKLLRSGQMEIDTGIIVPQAADMIDLVEGTKLKIEFLQRTQGGRFVFRVYERFVLRIRDQNQRPVAGFRIGPSAAQRTAERNALTANGILF